MKRLMAISSILLLSALPVFAVDLQPSADELRQVYCDAVVHWDFDRTNEQWNREMKFLADAEANPAGFNATIVKQEKFSHEQLRAKRANLHSLFDTWKNPIRSNGENAALQKVRSEAIADAANEIGNDIACHQRCASQEGNGANSGRQRCANQCKVTPTRAKLWECRSPNQLMNFP